MTFRTAEFRTTDGRVVTNVGGPRTCCKKHNDEDRRRAATPPPPPDLAKRIRAARGITEPVAPPASASGRFAPTPPSILKKLRRSR